MTDPKRPWLPRAGLENAREELTTLLLTHRSTDAVRDDHEDPNAWARREWRERRIRHLQELLLGGDVADTPRDGIAEAGMVVTVRFGDGRDTETFLLADGGSEVCTSLETYSTDGPVGRALLGAQENETRTCLLPDGERLPVTLLTATPFREAAVY